jgi:membrane protein YdbS with pleckstrin-like domain
MEIAVIIIVAILFFFVIPYLRKKIWRKATGEDKKVPTLDSNEPGDGA